MTVNLGLITVFATFLAAPLVLGSYLVVQQRVAPLTLGWFTGITGLLAVSLLLAALTILGT